MKPVSAPNPPPPGRQEASWLQVWRLLALHSPVYSGPGVAATLSPSRVLGCSSSHVTDCGCPRGRPEKVTSWGWGHTLWASALWAGESTRRVSERMGPHGLTHRDQTPRSLRESAPRQQSRAPKGELFSQLSAGTSRSASPSASCPGQSSGQGPNRPCVLPSPGP